ncbi:MAG: TIGR04551 family protein [Anaeromyxobacteraceae bacterium]
MIRLAAALAASLLLAPAALAQAKPDAKPEATKPDAAKPDKPAAPLDLDAKTQEAIRRAVEKAKEEIRDEVRAELQGAQSAAEFLGTAAEGPKLEFFELDGYFRTRGQLYDQLGLGVNSDAAGFPFFPKPLFSPDRRSTNATTNMRLRLEPTLNVSDNVRVKAQIDVLDNYVLGSSANLTMDSSWNPYFASGFYGSSRVAYDGDNRNDRPAITPKRAWAEAQTPAGLLSFGRMPSAWGLGILTNAGTGLDQDYGDTVDRIQFALPPVATPIGQLTFIPMLDFDSEGALQLDRAWGSGVGQPFDVDSADDARTYAIKAVRIDTEDELRRKLDRGESSFNFGAYYNYRTQRNVFPDWLVSGYNANLVAGIGNEGAETFANRRAYGHVIDGWARWVSPRWRLEFEGVGALGHIGNAFVVANANIGTVADPAIKSMGSVLVRQWGAVLQTEFKAIPNKVSLGLEIGLASGDNAPGMGNSTRGATYDATSDSFTYQPYGSLEGPQFGDFAALSGAGGIHHDRDIRNFRFNPAYRIDEVLFRTILGGITDTLYVRPSLRWDMFPGLALDTAIIYSQAMYGESTPSAAQQGDVNTQVVYDHGNKALGLELDTKLTYTGVDGFAGWFSYGLLQPLGAFGTGLSRGHALQFGFAAKF